MPSTVPTCPLHCATCFEDLTSQAEVKFEKKNPKMVCKSLGKLLDEGKKHRLTGDDEMAYIVYMRWIHCIRWLQKTPDFTENKDFLKPYVSGSKVKEILSLLEEIADRLKNRYKVKRLEENTKQILNTVEKVIIESDHMNDDDLLNEVGDIELNLPDTPTDDPDTKLTETSITCMEMFQEMQKLVDRIIIIDIRPRGDFQNSHIRSDQCINIPTDLIKTGILATDLFKQLNGDERTCRVIRHRAREYCDLIVLLDWQSTKASLQSTNQLNVLRNILLDWDPGVAYKRIVVLHGGYKEWLTCFPTFTTNPGVMPPDIEDDSMAGILEEVEYPEWNQSDEDQPMSEIKVKQIPARSLKPMLNEKKDSQIRYSNTLDNRNSDRVNTLYSNKKNSKYSATLTGTLKIQADPIDDQPKAIILPKKIAEISHPSGLRVSQNDEVQSIIIESAESNVKKPTVDRSSKPNIEKTYDLDSEKVLNLLRFKRDTVNTQLKLAKKKLLLESQLVRRDNDDVSTQLETETSKQTLTINEAMIEKMKQISSIKEALDRCKRDGIKVNPKHHDEEVRLELDIGVAEQEAQYLAIEQRVLVSERDKKLEENEEMKRKNMSTPPTAIEKDTKKTPLKQDGQIRNSALKRSYSSPNLVKLETRNESATRGLDCKTPQVDRTSKPLVQHQHKNNIMNNTFINTQPLRRDREQRMNPVFGNMHPGITGLKNLGNSCYMNSIIQCLSNTTSLARYFIHGLYTDDLNTKNKKTQGQVVEEVAQVIKALWCGHYRSISPRDLKVAIGQYKMQFESYEQQDSHEFLTFLLDWMHNDLKTKAKPEVDRLISNADKEWDKALDGQTSIISQLFFGQLRSTISCATCGNSSTTYESFNSLTLSLPDTNRCTLDDCIRKYVSGQRVSGWRCPSCKTARDATKKFDFVKLAPIIVIHLNRFGETGGWIQKINTAVDFPLVSLDLRSYVAYDSGSNITTPNSYQQTYNLYAVSNHYGTMDGGHYTAYCNSASQNKWYKYDDHTVREVPPSEVKSQTASAYLLFYTSVRNSPYIGLAKLIIHRSMYNNLQKNKNCGYWVFNGTEKKCPQSQYERVILP
ncbi:ubiquitin carboxyl-terminal hydrolase 8 isoform X5 [Neodiprion pinetum]|nr:ubiquitin carboxyl-terminal hydrolase 8 isoform X5 [Neodiprion pinetum]XP_046489133.1 ubiquitin carboxyl-terminal hydrolase 8 isoform X5 [Neodiprion pinetum]